MSYSALFCSVLFGSVLLFFSFFCCVRFGLVLFFGMSYSVLFCSSVLWILLFCSVRFCSVLLFFSEDVEPLTEAEISAGGRGKTSAKIDAKAIDAAGEETDVVQGPPTAAGDAPLMLTNRFSCVSRFLLLLSPLPLRSFVLSFSFISSTFVCLAVPFFRSAASHAPGAAATPDCARRPARRMNNDGVRWPRARRTPPSLVLSRSLTLSSRLVSSRLAAARAGTRSASGRSR